MQTGRDGWGGARHLVAKPAMLRPNGWQRAIRLSAGLCLMLGCSRSSDSGGPRESAGGETVARVGDWRMTNSELQAQLGKAQDGVAGARRLVDEGIRFQLLVQEAERRGYGKHPEIVLLMKKQMISRMLADSKDLQAVDVHAPVTEEEVAAHFRKHADEFSKAEEIQMAQIVVSHQGKARQAAREAMKARSFDGGKDQRAFQELVTRYSEDGTTRGRGGVLPFFSRERAPHHRSVVDAAFKLETPGAVSPPVLADGRYHVLKLISRRPAVTRSLDDVRGQIRMKLQQGRRTESLDAFVESLRTRAAVEVNESALRTLSMEAGSR